MMVPARQATFSAKKTRDYSIVHNGFLRDKNLSLRAKGMLAYLLALPEDRHIRLSELQRHHRDGVKSVHSAIQELIQAGYIVFEGQEDTKTEAGKDGMSLLVFEVPHSDGGEFSVTGGLPLDPPSERTPPSPPGGDDPLTEEAWGILRHLNAAAEANFRKSETSLRPILARLREGYSPSDCLLVIDFKVFEWGKDPNMAQYLRPTTLFCPSKFPGYLAAAQAWKKNGKKSAGSNARLSTHLAVSERELAEFKALVKREPRGEDD